MNAGQPDERADERADEEADRLLERLADAADLVMKLKTEAKVI